MTPHSRQHPIPDRPCDSTTAVTAIVCAHCGAPAFHLEQEHATQRYRAECAHCGSHHRYFLPTGAPVDPRPVADADLADEIRMLEQRLDREGLLRLLELNGRTSLCSPAVPLNVRADDAHTGLSGPRRNSKRGRTDA